jgi:hypothetical protein
LSQQALSIFLCSVADLLRGDYRQLGCGKILSFAAFPSGTEGCENSVKSASACRLAER